MHAFWLVLSYDLLEDRQLGMYLLSRCRCKWGFTTEYLTRAVFVKQWTALHMVRTIHLSSCSFRWQKCGLRPKLFLRLNIFSTFKGVHTLIFTYVPCIAIGLHEKQANFYGEKCEWAGSQSPLICHGIYYKSSFKIFDFFFLPFKYPWLRSHDFMYIFKSGKSVCVTVCRSGYQCLIIWGPVYMEAGYPR